MTEFYSTITPNGLNRIECINPILNISDMKVTRNFYVSLLGFKEEPWGNDDFTCISRDQSAIYLCCDGQGSKPTCLWVGFNGDIFALYNDLKSKGITIHGEPQNYSWALEMQVEDPDGHVLRFGTDPLKNQPFIDKERS
jgi:predicted lactoylglutathione lyase